MAQHPRPKDEPQVFHGAPVEAVVSTGDITGAKVLGTDPEPAPAPSALASEEAARQAVNETQEEFRTREMARRQNLAEQTKVGGDVNHDAARAEGERRAQLEREKRLMKRKPGIYVRSQVKLMNEAGVAIECPEGMRLPDEMVSRISDLKALCDGGVLDDLR